MPGRSATILLLSAFCLTLLISSDIEGQTESARTLQPPPRSKLVAVNLPDTAKLEPEVREQITAFQTSLKATLNDASVTPATLAEAYGTMGQVFHAYSLTLPARECYGNALVLAPGDFRWTYLLAKIDQQEDRVEAAIKRFLEARALRPDYVALHLNLGNLFLQLNRLEEAVKSFQSALALEATNAAANYGLGQVALSQRRYADAVRYLEQALKRVPEANRIHYSLAMAHRALGNAAQAKAHLTQQGAVGVRITDPLFDQLKDLLAGERLHLIRGRMAFDARRFADAAAEFRKAIAAKPDSVTAHLNLGAALTQMNDLPGAEAEFATAVRLEPEDANARFNLAVVLSKQGKHGPALEHLQALLSKNPNDHAARFFLAQEFVKLDRSEDALREFSRVARDDPTNEEALLEEVKLLQRKELHKEARDRLASSYAANPQRVQTTVTLAYLLAVSPQKDLRDGARALELAQHIFQETGLPQYGAVVAMALAELGRCADAADWQRKMIALAKERQQPDLAAQLTADLKLYESGDCRPPGH